jgi:hypothetical protein
MRCQPGGPRYRPVKGGDVARCGDVYENTVTGERGVAPRGNEDDDGQSALVHLIVQPHGQLPASIFTRGSGRGSGSSPLGPERAWTGSSGPLPPAGRQWPCRACGTTPAIAVKRTPASCSSSPPGFPVWADDRDDVRAGECGPDQRHRDARSVAAGHDRLPPPRPYPRSRCARGPPGWHRRTRMIWAGHGHSCNFSVGSVGLSRRGVQ